MWNSKIQLDISYIKYIKYIFYKSKENKYCRLFRIICEFVELSLNAIYWYFKELHMGLTLVTDEQEYAKAKQR